MEEGSRCVGACVDLLGLKEGVLEGISVGDRLGELLKVVKVGLGVGDFVAARPRRFPCAWDLKETMHSHRKGKM